MTVSSLLSAPLPSGHSEDPVAESQKRNKAAKDFEALLISQMLQSMRKSGSSWLGTGDDQSSEAAFGLGEQELAKAITDGGGLGLSGLIASGLDRKL